MEKIFKNPLIQDRRSLLKVIGAGALSSSVNFPLNALSDEGVFSDIRQKLMLPSELVYLNTGTLGPMPTVIFDKIIELSKRLEANPAIENFGPMGQEMEKVRAIAANFIGGDPDEIILTRNTTEGINTVCSSIDFKNGDEILTTNHEHGGAETGLDFLAKSKGAVIKKMAMPVPARSVAELVALVRTHLTEKTKLILLSHVETVTGLKWPIREVAELIKGKDIIFIVDGAQAPGMIDVNVHELGCDVYACSGHKWIMGPKETGIVYLKKDMQNKIDSVFLSGGYGVYSRSSGTRNAPNIIGFGDVMEWHMEIGKGRIEKQCKNLARYCREKLENIKGLKIITPDDPELSTAIVSFSLDEGYSARDLFIKMRDNGITIKRLPQYNAIRISNHMFTTNDDVDKMIMKLQQWMG